MRVYALKDTLQASFGGEWGNDCILGEGVAVLRTTNFTNTGNISYCNVVERDIADGKVQKKKLRVGDIILEKSGGTKNTPVGRVVYFDRSDKIYLCNNFTQVLRPNLQIVDGKYLFYCLYAKYQFHVTDGLYNKTTGIQNLQMDRYFNLQIPVVDKEQQYKICKQLDALRAAIEKKKQVLRKFEDLVKSQFIEMFGGGQYPECPVKEFVAGKVESVRRRYKPKDQIRYVDISSIDNKLNQMTGFTEYTLKDAPSRAQQCIERGDILVSTVRPNLRNIAMNTFDDDRMVASSGFCVLRATSCERNYLFVALLLDNFSRKMSELTTGANYPAIKDSDILEYRIPKPPIDRQIAFARFVEQSDKSKFRIKQSLEKLEKCYKALLQKYFG